MKKSMLSITIATCLLVFLKTLYAESKEIKPLSPQVPFTSQVNNYDKIQAFVTSQSKVLSTQFPYKINLYTQGQIDKNQAGIRIAQTASQFPGGITGMLFYYQLYNHSMRVPHWHANAVEVGTVLSGKMRVTIWEGTGQSHIFTVEKNGTWMIPQAAVHSLENIGTDKLTFFVAYNSPNTADRDFATAWSALPNELLQSAVGITKEETSLIRKSTNNRLSGFDPSAGPDKVELYSPFSGNFKTVQAVYDSNLGSIKRVDATSTPKMQYMTLQQTILKPGTLRLPHWYTSGDCMLFIFQGSAYFTMMDSLGKVYSALLKPGDLISLPVGTFHTYLNIGKNDLEVYEAFNVAKDIQEITLLAGAQQFSVGTMEGAIGVSKDIAQRMAKLPIKEYMTSF